MEGDIATGDNNPNDLTSLEVQVWDLQQRLAAFEASSAPSQGQTAGAQERAVSDAARVDAYRQPKIPPFFRSDPAIWFIQVEASLRNAQISVESTKADFVLAAVDAEVVGCVKDIILTRPVPADVYQRIKARIIATFASSSEGNLRKLLKGQVLTDGKPSLLLSRLRNLNDGQCDDVVLKSIFLEQLPSGHRAILVAAGAMGLDRLAEIADTIAENAGPTEIHVASSSGTSPRPAPEIDLAACVVALTKQLERLNASSRKDKPRERARARSRSVSKQRNESQKRHKSGLCLAHRKYPQNPLSCREWCTNYASWKQKN